ncbi:serine/Arginine-related protein 53 [Microtus pennsylvanicus]|uniref:serine/Arginine-related protein 53 n=1 Tax=Microtus pennsylvanicus TaxID=10058 RepID=UPI003F6B54AF
MQVVVRVRHGAVQLQLRLNLKGQGRHVAMTILGKPQSLAQFLAHESVWIVSLIEKPLQLVELFQGKIGSTSPLLDFGLAFVLHPFRIVFAILQFGGHWRGHHGRTTRTTGLAERSQREKETLGLRGTESHVPAHTRALTRPLGMVPSAARQSLYSLPDPGRIGTGNHAMFAAWRTGRPRWARREDMVPELEEDNRHIAPQPGFLHGNLICCLYFCCSICGRLGKGFGQTRDYRLFTTGLLVSSLPHPLSQRATQTSLSRSAGSILPLAKKCISLWSRALCAAALLPVGPRVLSRLQDRGKREGELRPGTGHYHPSAAGCPAPCSAPRLPCPAPGRESALLQLLRLLLLLQHLLRLLRLRLRLLPRRRLRRPPGLPGCCGRRGPARCSPVPWPHAAAHSLAPPEMGRRSSDTEEESRSKRKKKHRRRSSSSSSSDSRTYSRKKGGRRPRSESRSWSRDRQPRSHSYERRRRHRSSSSSSYGSRRKRSRSRSRGRGKSYRVQRSRSKSRTRRSRSRPRPRSHSRSSERSSHRRTRSRSRDRERRKARDKEKRDQEKDKGKDKEGHNIKRESGNIKAGLEHLPPAEQAKARLQMVLEAAAKADEALKAKERNEEEAKRRKEEDQATLVEQVKRVKEIEAIESDSFVQQTFRSSKEVKKSAEPSEVKHATPASGPASVAAEPPSTGKEIDPDSIPTAIKYQDDNSLAHPNLFVEKADAEEKWFKRLIALRQERLMGSPVA